jgi:hypothetical protein
LRILGASGRASEEPGHSIEVAPVKTRRQFDLAYKREAVRNGLGNGNSVAGVAKKLGLAESQPFVWSQRLPPPTSRRSWRRLAVRSSCASSGTF